MRCRSPCTAEIVGQHNVDRRIFKATVDSNDGYSTTESLINFNVSAVLGKLALYLYLDQYEIHEKAHQRHAKERMKKAERLTRMAVYGEKLYGVRLWFLHRFLLMLRWFVIGGETNKEANQEKQAVWLRDKLIELGPTFIKIGQSMGTRADLLPLQS